MFVAKLPLYAMIAVEFFTVSTAMASSKDPPSNSTLESSLGRVVYGSEEPEKITEYTKYHMLIGGYELRVQGDLGDKLSAKDQQVLRDMAVQGPIERQRLNEEYDRATLHLCANRGSMTPVEIAQARDKNALVWRVTSEARLRKGFDALSDAGRQIVEEYVATEIVPGIVQSAPESSVDHVRRDPGGFREAVELECYFYENGEYPPGVQEEIDEALRKTGRGRTTQPKLNNIS